MKLLLSCGEGPPEAESKTSGTRGIDNSLQKKLWIWIDKDSHAKTIGRIHSSHDSSFLI